MQRIFIILLLIGCFSSCDTFEKRREQALNEKREDSLRQVAKQDSLKKEKKMSTPTYKLTDSSTIVIKKTEPTPTISKEIKEVKEVKETKSTKLFYVIAGSFAKREEADKLLQRLKTDKFSKAEIINDDKGGFRVSVQSFSNKDDAKKLSETVKTKYTDISSWVLAK